VSAQRRVDFDVAIVGGGIVGPAVAGLLAADERTAPWRVALIERHEPRRPDPARLDLRVSAISRASQRILEVAGAWAGVASDAAPYTEMVVWDAASRPDAGDALHFSAAETGEPDLGAIVENLRLQWALVEAPPMRRVTLLHTGLERLEATPGHVRLDLSDQRTVRAALVIGADGGQSQTRELAHIGRAGRDYDQAAVVAHLRTARPHAETAWQRFLPAGPLALLPLRDGRVSTVWTMDPATARELCAVASPEFSARITAASDDVLGRLDLDSERASFALGRWQATAYCQPRVALVGDAAHTIHPLAGQGANLGLLDAAALVEVLGDAVAADEDWTGMRVLRRYERWRRSENTLVLGLTDGLNRLFGATDDTTSALRRFGLGVVASQSWMRRALIERALGVAGEVPRIVSRAALA
jgi:2-octaprenylphenol hydroxylase